MASNDKSLKTLNETVNGLVAAVKAIEDAAELQGRLDAADEKARKAQEWARELAEMQQQAASMAQDVPPAGGEQAEPASAAPKSPTATKRSRKGAGAASKAKPA